MSIEWKVEADELVDLIKNRDSGSIEEVNSKKWGGAKGMAKKLKSNLETGLIEADEDGFTDRIAHFGTNELPKRPPKSLISFWIEAIQDRTLIILIIAAVVSIGLGVGIPPPGESRSTGWIEGTAILIAVALVSVVTAVNDWSKDKKFRELSELSNERKIKLLRNGKLSQISTLDIVVGDIVCLETGDYIPADLLYISGQGITVDESSMTGEPDAIAKKVSNPYFLSGCTVMEGFARGIVVATGARTEWGRLKALLEKPAVKTPLQDHLENLADNIGKLGLIMAVITFVGLIIRWAVQDYSGSDALEWEWNALSNIVQFAIIAITIVVVAVPEGLPLAVTLSLAFSMMKMMKDQNLVRHLVACETMGGATAICSDKTGTLTQNRMTVVKLWLTGETFEDIPSKAPDVDEKVLNYLNEGIGANSTAYIEERDGQKQFIGAKTECALLVLEQKFGSSYEDVRKNSDIVRIFPFSSKKKRMSTLVRTETGYLCYCKGASEVLLDTCVDALDKEGNKRHLSDEEKKDLLKVIEGWASQGLRTLTLAYRELPDDIEMPSETSKETPFDQDLTLIAIVGIEDPLREEVPQSVRECQGAGITVRMLTGDNILTAKSIGERCGILTEGGIAIEGPDFRKMSTQQLDEIIPKLQIIARCSPEDKMILVTRLQQLGEVVAVTGDGTNDAPALSQADVGFAMGISGTEVAKGASDIILLDDNFSSIEKAVMWGRNVYDSIRKFLQFQLTVNVVAVVVAFIGAVTTGHSPLTAVQLLWVNLIMDTMAALALATEPPTRELLNRPPHGRYAPLITFKMWRTILGQSAFQLFVCFFLLYGGDLFPFLETDRDKMTGTLIFNTFVFLQIFNEINARKLGDEKNIFEGFHRNYIFMAIVVITIVVQILLVQFGGTFTQTIGLDIYQWLFCILVGTLSMPIGILIRFVPVPSDKWMENRNRAKALREKQNVIELDDIQVEDATVEERKSLKDNSEERDEDSDDSDDESKGKRQSALLTEDGERRPRSASQNWQIAKQAVVKAGVISAFRRPVRGVQFN